MPCRLPPGLGFEITNYQRSEALYAPRDCDDQPKPTLLFVCVHDAGRSQLAAGLAALRGGDQVNVLSAGLDPDDRVSEVALASLAEAGIDRSDQTPTKLTADMVAQADVVALKPGLDLPHRDGVRRQTGPLPDPAEWDIDGIRPLRDYIDTKVQELLTELTPQARVPSGA